MPSLTQSQATKAQFSEISLSQGKIYAKGLLPGMYYAACITAVRTWETNGASINVSSSTVWYAIGPSCM